MKISQEVRDIEAAKLVEQQQEGMSEQAARFKAQGGELYLPTSETGCGVDA